MFYGSIPALITPFKNGAVDIATMEKLVARQLKCGSHGLVPCGTTGECPTLEDEEYNAIFDCTVAAVKSFTQSHPNKKIPVIGGVGSNSTAKAIKLSHIAEKAGCDALLVVAPYYNRPTQEGLYQHFKSIHDNTSLPIILYNVPGRTVIEISTETISRLAELPRIKGLKDATSDLTRITLLKNTIPADFALLSGEDGLAGGHLAQGAVGCISVTANLLPHLCAELQESWMMGDKKTFNTLQQRLALINKTLFFESSPAPLKYAMSRLGLIENELRLPLIPASTACRAAIDEALDNLADIIEPQQTTQNAKRIAG